MLVFTPTGSNSGVLLSYPWFWVVGISATAIYFVACYVIRKLNGGATDLITRPLIGRIKLDCEVVVILVRHTRWKTAS